MFFNDITGHDAVKDNLRSMLRGGRLPHALLLTSNPGVGALPLAMAFAQYVLCRDRTETDSCGVCGDCYKMERLEHPDCHCIFPVNSSKLARTTGRSDEKPVSDQFIHLWREAVAATGGYISQEQWYQAIDIENKQGIINKNEANELLRKMSFKSFGGGYKVAVVWLPELMNDAAANTLLKLIEEPAPQTLFLFASENPDRIIPTIRSRTQVVNLADLSPEVIERNLVERLGTEAGEAASAARAAGGSWGRALSIAGREEGEPSQEDYQRFSELMRLCYGSKYLDLFEWAAQMASAGREAQKRFCVNSISMIRDCYMLNIGMDDITYMTAEREKFCRNFAPYVSHVSTEQLVEEFQLLLRQVIQNGNPKILFTHFALTVCKIIGNAKGYVVAGK